MKQLCLIVGAPSILKRLKQATAEMQFALATCCVDAEEAYLHIEAGRAVAMVMVFGHEESFPAFELADAFCRRVAPLPHLIGVVCDDPSIKTMTDLYEWGLDCIWGEEKWLEQLALLCQRVTSFLKNQGSLESQSMRIVRATQQTDKKEMTAATEVLQPFASYHFLAAYTLGLTQYVTGHFKEALPLLENATKLNEFFRPAWAVLAELLMVFGRFDEALKIWKHLDHMSLDRVDYKAYITMTLMELGDLETAGKILADLELAAPNHPKVHETQILKQIKSGNVPEVLQAVDQMRDTSPYFAAKLNDLGIALSQDPTRSEDALSLYQKAHRVVRSEIRHKISLNAALTAYRLKRFEDALKHLNRCEAEYGAPMEKVDKVRKACLQLMAERKVV